MTVSVAVAVAASLAGSALMGGGVGRLARLRSLVGLRPAWLSVGPKPSAGLRCCEGTEGGDLSVDGGGVRAGSGVG